MQRLAHPRKRLENQPSPGSSRTTIDCLAQTFVWKFINAKKKEAAEPEAEAADAHARAKPGAGERPDGEEKRERKREREPMFKRIGELTATPREWLIRGFLARNEVGNPFGRPDAFKGVVAAQLCVHIAGGARFSEWPSSRRLPPISPPSGASRRNAATRATFSGLSEKDMPCYFGSRPINLLDERDVDFLLGEIMRMAADAGGPLGFLAVDTQSRTLDGNENSTEDGSKYAKAIERIRQETGASLWIIAHVGHAETAQDRPRGTSSLLAAYDTFYRHQKRDETHGSIKITIDRDGLGQKEFDFIVDLFPTGLKNEDGEPVLVPYVEPDKEPLNAGNLAAAGIKVKPIEPTAIEREARLALGKAIKDHGIATPEGEGQLQPSGEYIPPGVVTVSLDEWRAGFLDLDRRRERGASRRAFDRASKGLAEKGLVGKFADRRWLK